MQYYQVTNISVYSILTVKYWTKADHDIIRATTFDRKHNLEIYLTLYNNYMSDNRLQCIILIAYTYFLEFYSGNIEKKPKKKYIKLDNIARFIKKNNFD